MPRRRRKVKALVMRLAKDRIDIGLATNDLEPMLRFWREEAGLPFDHRLRIRAGRDQYRHDALGSVVKINHHLDALPGAPPATVYDPVATGILLPFFSVVRPPSTRMTS